MREIISRRDFIKKTTLASTIALATNNAPSFAMKNTKIKAIGFDGFSIFDPRPIFQTVNEIFPIEGKLINEIWSSKQFAYQWLRLAAGQYKDFWQVTSDALDFAVAHYNVQLSEHDKQRILNQYNKITVWPDVASTLTTLKDSNIQLFLLSNMTQQMLLKGVENSITKYLFDHIISTDIKHTFKPAQGAYQMGVDATKLRKEEMLFVPSAGWDVAGAKWFGYPTFWVNRLNAKSEQLDAMPDGAGKSLTELVSFIKEFN